MKQIIKQDRFYPAAIVLLLALYTLYLWLFVNPSLYLIKSYPAFFTDGYFFREMMGFPGRPVEYLSRFVVQLYAFPLVASLLVGLCLTSIYFLGLQLFKGEKYAYGPAYLPVLVLLFMRNEYGHAVRFDLDILTLNAVLLLFVLSLRRGGRMTTLVGFPLLLAFVLYVNGISVALTFLGFILITLLLRKEKISLIGGLMLEACGVFAVFYFVFHLSYHDWLQEITDRSRLYTFRYFPLVLYLTVALLPVVAVLWTSFRKKVPVKGTWLAIGSAPVILVLLILSLNKEEKRSLAIQYAARNGDWEKTLSLARKCEYPDKNVVYYTNLALYQTGRIAEDLFLYNQSFGSDGLLLAEMNTFSEIVPNQEIFLQMGALSLSIIWGTEATNVYGANPFVLRNLVKAYLAGGYIREAQKILNQLDRSLFQKDWVARYRSIANDPTAIDRDPELKRLRDSQTPLAVIGKQSALMNLYFLSENNPSNRMPYDYLLTGTLLDHQLDNFALCISRLDEYGYDAIPKLYLEGLLYNTLYSTAIPLDIRAFRYDPAVLQRFASFRNDLVVLQRDPHKGKQMLQKKYGDTYWYYLLFDSKLSDERRMDVLLKMIS